MEEYHASISAALFVLPTKEHSSRGRPTFALLLAEISNDLGPSVSLPPNSTVSIDSFIGECFDFLTFRIRRRGIVRRRP